MKILIAEDDRVSRTFMEKFMSAYGQCDIAVDGMEAIDLFMEALKRREPYDLDCLDIMMPKVDGIKVLKVIRTMEKQQGIVPARRTRVLMTTALADVAYIDKAFALGADGYAAKPIDTEKMAEVFENLGLVEKET